MITPRLPRWVASFFMAMTLMALSAVAVDAQTASTTLAAPASVAGPKTDAAAAPQPKPLLILRTGGKMIVLRARTATLGTNLLIEPLNGAAQSIEASAYVNQLAWYTDAELGSGHIDLNALAIRYRAFGGLYKEAQPTLYAEAQRFRDIAERLKNVSRQQTAETQKRAADFLALHFDPAKSSTRHDVASLVREADELTGLVPAQAAQIAQVAAPIREALAKLDAGQTFFEGQWRPGSKVQSIQGPRADDAVRQTFDKTLALPLEPFALSSSQLIKALALPLIVLLILFIEGLILVLGKHRGLGALLLAVVVATGGLGYASLSENNAGGLAIVSPDSPEAQKSSDRIVRLLYQASRGSSASLSPEDRDVRLTNADLSSFLARHVTHKGDAETGGGLRWNGLALGVTADGFTVLERAAAVGQTVYLRYDVKLDATGKTPVIKAYSVKAGRVTLPAPISDWLWAEIGPALGEYIDSHRIIAALAVTDMNRGEIDLAATRPTAGQGAAADTQPAPVPEPVATPNPQ